MPPMKPETGKREEGKMTATAHNGSGDYAAGLDKAKDSADYGVEVKAAHTPIIAEYPTDHRKPIILRTRDIVHPGAVVGEEIGRIHKRENAAFIVRAVNAHEELIKAARTCLELIDGDKRWLAAVIAKAEAR